MTEQERFRSKAYVQPRLFGCLIQCVCVAGARAVDIKGYSADLMSACTADEVMSGRGG